MPMPLFPEATTFVEECQTSVGIYLVDSITKHMLFELVSHVQGTFSSEKAKGIQFCGLLSGMLKNVPTEDGPMRVIWARVQRMLQDYKDLIRAAQSNKNFDRLWSPERNDDLRQKLQETFQIDPPQVLVTSNALPF